MKEIKALTKVIASLHPGSLRVIIGYGYSHADGGIEENLKSDRIFHDLTIPNSEFILVWNQETGEIIRVERLNTKFQNNNY
ncbi:MAG: hypothetical protein AB4368_29655 [Xenococcaceae cyanobacterium]